MIADIIAETPKTNIDIPTEIASVTHVSWIWNIKKFHTNKI